MTFNWIDLVSSLLGLACVFLAGRGSKYNFWVGYLYTAALFVLFWQKHLVASLLLQPISLGINILGHYRWTHPKEGEASSEKQGELKVTMLTWPERIPRRSAPVSGFLRHHPDPRGPVPQRPEEMGLLGGLDHRQHYPIDPAPVGGQHLHADRQCALPGQRHRFAGELAKNV